MGWQGFVITVSIALGGTAAAAVTLWLWPRRIPEPRSVDGIKRRFWEEDDTIVDVTLWTAGFPHDAPDEPLSVYEAQKTMQRHRACLRDECPRKQAAWQVLVDAGHLKPDPRRNY